MRGRNLLHLLVAVALLFSLTAVAVSAAPAQTPLQPPVNPSGVLGPFTRGTHLSVRVERRPARSAAGWRK